MEAQENLCTQVLTTQLERAGYGQGSWRQRLTGWSECRVEDYGSSGRSKTGTWSLISFMVQSGSVSKSVDFIFRFSLVSLNRTRPHRQI